MRVSLLRRALVLTVAAALFALPVGARWKRNRGKKSSVSPASKSVDPTLSAAAIAYDLGLSNTHRLYERLDRLSESARTFAAQNLQRQQWKTLVAEAGDSLEIDASGALFVSDRFQEVPQLGARSVGTRRRRTRSGTRPPSGFTADGIPVYHSNPGSEYAMYLDFTGHTHVQATHDFGRGPEPVGWSNFVAQPFDLDGDTANFSVAEIAFIAETWDRVTEDYSPWVIDVTTEEPASMTPKVAHVLITSSMQVRYLWGGEGLDDVRWVEPAC